MRPARDLRVQRETQPPAKPGDPGGRASLLRRLFSELLQNTSDPTDFAIAEEWDSEQHYAGHFEVEHVKQALGQFAELAAKPLEIRRYERLE